MMNSLQLVPPPPRNWEVFAASITKAKLTSFVFAQSFGSRLRRRAFLAGVDVLNQSG